MDEGNTTTRAHTGGQRFIIKRPRLTRLLDESEARIILLVAPAGYGKTTLAREWLTEREAVAWYGASPASADVAALAAGMAVELDLVMRNEDQPMLARLGRLLHFQQRPDVLARTLAATEDQWPRLIVVVDDYHLLAASEDAEEFVGALVSRLPARFVITSRARPRWMNARASVYGNVLEIGVSELAMTDDEADEVLRVAHGDRATRSIRQSAHGWPAVLGLAVRTDRQHIPETMPSQLYEFLANDLIATASTEMQQALELIAVTQTRERELAHRIIGEGAEEALNEAQARGLLALDDGHHIALHPLLSDFLIARLQRGDAKRTAYADVIETLVAARRWDECLALAEALPEAAVPVGQILHEALEELLRSGRVATARRWVDLARRRRLDEPIIDLADAEAALRRGDHRHALTLGSRASERLELLDETARAALVAARAAHLQDLRDVAKHWFKRADVAGARASTRALAIWGQFLVEDEEQSSELEAAVARVESATDGTVEYALRISQARLLLAIANRRIDLALAEIDAAEALLPLASDPLAVLASRNHKAWVLVSAGRYAEAIATADIAIAEALSTGIDFVVHHCLFPKASALIGRRRFGAAKNVLSQLLGRIDSARDGWAMANLAMQHAKLQISLGNLARAADHLGPDPDEHMSLGLRGEYESYRALIAAAQGSFTTARKRVESALRFSHNADAFALTSMTNAIIAADGRKDNHAVVESVSEVLKAGHADSVVIACRACPRVAAIGATDETQRVRLTTLLTASCDEAVARAAGLRIRRAIRRDEALSPREQDVYELMAQGLTNPEIARVLFISESTTKVHVRHILEKLGARSRVEAVRAYDDRCEPLGRNRGQL